MAARKNVKQPKDRLSTAKTWKRNRAEELELPSGNVALVKRPGPAALLSGGVLPDTLTPIIQEAVRSGKGLPPEKQAEFAEDPEKVADMVDAMDRMLAMVVVEPAVAYHRRETGKKTLTGKNEWEDIPPEDRDEDSFVYTDDVVFEDKTFIFNYAVGGTRDLERFRKEQHSGLGDVSDGDGSVV